MQHLARQVQSQGRGNDTMLVHMTPREVGGLQALARAHGGSLTVNPHTGLAEAGFLDSILPILGGALLSFIPGVGPIAAGALVGGGTALATGDISKGLMAGLGAFGGAGIGNALGGLGAAAPEVASPLVTGATPGVPSAAFDAATGELLPEAVSGIPGSAGLLPNAANASTQSILAGGTAPTPYTAPSISQGLTDIGAGIDKLGQPGGLDKLWAGMGQQMGPQWGRMAGLAGIAAPMLMQQPQGYTPPQYKGSPFTLTSRKPTGVFDSRPGVSSERTYFNPVNPFTDFTPPYASGGSVKRMADGGSAEQIYFNRAAALPTKVQLPPQQRGLSMLDLMLTGGRGRPMTSKTLNFGGVGTPIASQPPQTLQPRQPVVPPMGLPSSAERLYDFGNRASFLPPTANATPSPSPNRLINRSGIGMMGGYAAGGETLRDGSFILDARTVSEIGNGSSNAGQERLARLGGKPIRGPGDGVSDSIRANIGGRQEARVARDEVKFEPETVARIGGGDARKGTQKLYALMRKAQQARRAADRGEDTRVARGLGAL